MIFGTDGIRAIHGTPPLDAMTLGRLSTIIDHWLASDAPVVVGRDGRASGSELLTWVLSAIRNDIVDLDVVPTPVVAQETAARSAALGIMVTASHNPPQYNGLKFFGPDGMKISEETARSWSDQLEKSWSMPPVSDPVLNRVSAVHYSDFVVERFGAPHLDQVHVVFDLAHGSATAMVPLLSQKLGLKAHMVAEESIGSKINLGVGALHPGHVGKAVVEQGADVGFAFDGDADRLVVVGPDGVKVPGDVVMYAMLLCYEREDLDQEAMVGTILNGLGLEWRLKQEGRRLLRTGVGDQQVLARMIQEELDFGGEPSGHFIQRDLFPAGDGFVAALRLIDNLAMDPTLLENASAAVPIFPIIERNIRVARKTPIASLPRVRDAIAHLERLLADDGRLIVRYSGTEPLLRLFVEGRDLSHVESAMSQLEQSIQQELT